MLKNNKKSIFTLIAVIIVIVIVILLTSNHHDKKSPTVTQTENPDSITTKKLAPVLKFGLPVDSFDVIDGQVKRNENLSAILLKQNISYAQIDLLAKKSKSIFDVRQIRVGNKYHFFQDKDSIQSLAYFVYEIDPINYIVYGFPSKDSVSIRREVKPVRSVRKVVSGTIKNSLWNAMVDAKANPVLAMELSEIYAWTIDFFEIDKGDHFKIIYDENYVDTTSIGIGTIYASEFTHRNHHFYAYRFEQDSTFSYYDEDGLSLKKAFLKAPLKYSRISSRFTSDRYHPILKIHRPHHGVDYAAPSGTPIHSIGDGVITRKGYQKNGGGNYLYIKHNSVYTTSYMHMRSFAKGMAPGVFVKQGQLIGYVGQTGLATGPHLDFRVYKNGRPINPLKLKSPPVKPVSDTNKAKFDQLRDTMKEYLDKIND